jgi:hypothetical protein
MLLMDVLEHVEDDRGVLAPIVESLRQGAILLLTVPADMRLWSAHDEGVLHWRRYDESMLHALWRGLPVAPIALTHFCARLYPLAVVRRFLWRVRGFWPAPRNGWDMRVPPGPLNRMLERAFERETPRLIEVARGHQSRAYGYGVSLMALLRRTDREPQRGDRP